MPTLRKHLMVFVVALLALFFGSVRVVQAGVVETPTPANCRDLPVIKNLTGLKVQHVCERMAAKDQGRTEDHLTIARYYRAEANGLDAKAAGYELTAANLRHGPTVKNLVAPATAGRFEFAASRFREEAKADNTLAASHEEMAKTVVASLN